MTDLALVFQVGVFCAMVDLAITKKENAVAIAAGEVFGAGVSRGCPGEFHALLVDALQKTKFAFFTLPFY